VRRAVVGLLTTLCCFLTIGAPILSTAGLEQRWSTWTPAATVSPFRLGTAARPFAWATVIGDLNADGRPDFAVADRLGRGSAGFHYSVRFSVSGLPTQSVTFVSPDAALSISLRDVDHDQDLDIVVSTALSPTAVRVWLNDGRGVFSETANRDTPSEWHAWPVAAPWYRDATILADVTPRRAGPSAVSVNGLIAANTGRSPLHTRAAAAVALFIERFTPTRAPPALASFL
jgi:hypothetical protein